MITIRVQGGTSAGHRRIKQARTQPWRCHCPNPEGRTSRHALRPAYLVRCIDCGTRRPWEPPR